MSAGSEIVLHFDLDYLASMPECLFLFQFPLLRYLALYLNHCQCLLEKYHKFGFIFPLHSVAGTHFTSPLL
jgi:hypothetical protein